MCNACFSPVCHHQGIAQTADGTTRLVVYRVLPFMEIFSHVFSTLAYQNKKEKKGNPPNHYLDKQTYIARDTWMPSLVHVHQQVMFALHLSRRPLPLAPSSYCVQLRSTAMAWWILCRLYQSWPYSKACLSTWMLVLVASCYHGESWFVDL